MVDIRLQDWVTIAPDVVFRDLDGEAVVLNLQTGMYFGLNEVGTRMWTLIAEDGRLQRVFDALREEYDVSPDVLEADLLELVRQLQAKGLVEAKAAGTTS